MNICFDTSFLMDAIKNKIKLDDFYTLINEEIHFFITENAINELKKLSKNKGKKGMLAKTALDLIKLYNIKPIKTERMPVDETLIKLSKEGYAIATTDIKLAQKIKSRVFIIKNKNIKIY